MNHFDGKFLALLLVLIQSTSALDKDVSREDDAIIKKYFYLGMQQNRHSIAYHYSP